MVFIALPSHNVLLLIVRGGASVEHPVYSKQQRYFLFLYTLEVKQKLARRMHQTSTKKNVVYVLKLV